jgi:hypothetical protein
MNRLLLMFALLTGVAYGQTPVLIAMPATSSDKPADFKIGLACGFAGVSSKQFSEIHALIESKNYAGIVKNLRSRDLLTQLLSVIAAEELNNRNELSLTTKDLEIISNVKASDKIFHSCSGCTEHYYGKIADLFNSGNAGYSEILKAIRLEIGLDKNG